MRDSALAARIRAVARVLARQDVCGGAGVLGALAIELEAVALILDPEGTAADKAAIVHERLVLG